MTSAGNPEVLDGLRTWQAAVIRLWSASDEAFATLAVTWRPEGTGGTSGNAGGPWSVHLRYGDEGPESWSEEIRVSGAPTMQQALRRLWKRTGRHLGLLPPDQPPFSEDFEDEAWLTPEEIAVIERIHETLRPRQPIALRLMYDPEQGLSSQWIATLHDPAKEPPTGVTLTLYAEHLLDLCERLIETAG